MLQDMEIFDHHIGELILIDECEHPVVATHFQKIKMLVADMKLLMVTGETVVCFCNHFVFTSCCLLINKSIGLHFYLLWVKFVIVALSYF